jgi:hypothetical protein
MRILVSVVLKDVSESLADLSGDCLYVLGSDGSMICSVDAKGVLDRERGIAGEIGADTITGDPDD